MENTYIYEIHDGWKPGIIPKAGKRYSLASFSRALVLSEIDGNVAVTRRKEPLEPAYPDELRVEGGILKGVDDGEFCFGGITFIPDNGLEYSVLHKNFRGFYTVSDKIYALTGMAHMSTDEGNVFEIFCNSGKWEAREILNLGSCPHIFLRHENSIFLATCKDLLIIKDEKIAETLVENVGWGSFYPNSMLLANNSLYIGMRGGVFVYNLNSKEELWYDFLDSNPELESQEWFKNLDD